MKRFLILIILLCSGITAFSIPALKKVSKIKQPDGNFLDVILCGDEYSHFFMTTDSVPVFETSLGFCYGSLENGAITISEELAHNNLERLDNEKKYVEDKNKLRTFLVQKDKDKRSIGNLRRINARQKTRTSGVPGSFAGSKKGLVILVNFANLSMASSDAHGEFDALFNKEGYSKNGSVGSVHDYFYDQS